MPYAIPETIYRAYQRAKELLSSIRGPIPNSESPLIEELLIFGEGGDAGGDALYIRGPHGAIDWFKEYVEELISGAVRVTSENFHEVNPPHQPVQLLLDLEGRLEDKKESPPNN